MKLTKEILKKYINAELREAVKNKNSIRLSEVFKEDLFKNDNLDEQAPAAPAPVPAAPPPAVAPAPVPAPAPALGAPAVPGMAAPPAPVPAAPAPGLPPPAVDPMTGLPLPAAGAMPGMPPAPMPGMPAAPPAAAPAPMPPAAPAPAAAMPAPPPLPPVQMEALFLEALRELDEQGELIDPWANEKPAGSTAKPAAKTTTAPTAAPATTAPVSSTGATSGFDMRGTGRHSGAHTSELVRSSGVDRSGVAAAAARAPSSASLPAMGAGWAPRSALREAVRQKVKEYVAQNGGAFNYYRFKKLANIK